MVSSDYGSEGKMLTVIVDERAIDVPAWNDGCDERRRSSGSEQA